jgi:hypothetical protein
MTPYQYVIVRYRPNFSRGEFVNVGIVMRSLTEPAVNTMVTPQWERVKAMFPKTDKDRYQKDLDMMVQAMGDYTLEHMRETVFCPESCFPSSEIRAGIHEDPLYRLIELYQELVE